MKAVFMVLWLAVFEAWGQEGWLLDAEEAAPYQVDAANPGFDLSPTRASLRPGPEIQVLSPTLREDAAGDVRLETGEEVRLEVKFAKLTPASAEVDMRSFAAVMRKGGDWVPITERLKGYLRVSEQRLDAPRLRVPPGTYALKLKIKDTQGNGSESGFWLVVRD
ncbi:MAG: hypothetical protein ACKN9T_08995 [Candidatus Methylumidiphilus sp.]